MIILRLIDYIKKEKIKIVHTHSFNAHIWGGIAAKLAGCKIIEHVHDSRYIDPQEFEIRGEQNQQYKFVKLLNNFSDRVIVLTKQNYNFIMKHGLHKHERVSEIKNGIDLKARCHLTDAEKICLKKQLGIDPNAPIVLTPIRFSKEKNLNILFQIAMDVTRMLPQAVCVIAGSGPEKENFDAKVKSYNLQERIKTIGFCADIPRLLAISDVFLLPSTIELHSIAIMEAMRQKVPVVVSKNVGCNDDFIRHCENGILLDPFTREGWAIAIVELLEDHDLRRRMGEAGYQTLVEEFDIKDVARKFEHIYESLLFA
jgi:glycosyltransferase involved in cell wall biosynthesis